MEYIYFIFHSVNKIYFDDTIEVNEIRICKNLNTKKKNPVEGYCEYLPKGKKIRLSFSDNYFCGKLFVETIIHEMIHVWQYQNLGVINHCNSFKYWEIYFITKNFEI